MENLIISFACLSFLIWFDLWLNDGNVTFLDSGSSLLCVFILLASVYAALEFYQRWATLEQQIRTACDAEIAQQQAAHETTVEGLQRGINAQRRTISTLHSEKISSSGSVYQLQKKLTEYHVDNHRLLLRIKEAEARVKKDEGKAYDTLALTAAHGIEKQWDRIKDVMARAGISVTSEQDWTLAIEKLTTGTTAKQDVVSSDVEKAQKELNQEKSATEAAKNQVRHLEGIHDDDRKTIRMLEKTKSSLVTENETLRKELAAAQANQISSKELEKLYRRSMAETEEQFQKQLAAARDNEAAIEERVKKEFEGSVAHRVDQKQKQMTAAAQRNESAIRDEMRKELQHTVDHKDEEIRVLKDINWGEVAAKEQAQKMVDEMKRKFAAEVQIEVARTTGEKSADVANAALLQQRIDSLQGELAEAVKAKTEAHAEATRQLRRANFADNMYNQKHQNLNDANYHLENERARADILDQKVKPLEDELKEANEKLSRHTSQGVHLQRHATTIAKLNHDLKAEKSHTADLEQEVNTLQQQAVTSTQKVTTLEQQVTDCQQTIAERDEQTRDLYRMLHEHGIDPLTGQVPSSRPAVRSTSGGSNSGNSSGSAGNNNASSAFNPGAWDQPFKFD